MEYIVCGIDAGTGAPIWDVFDLEFASAAPAQGGRAGSVCLGLGAHPLRPVRLFRVCAARGKGYFGSL